LGRQAKEPLIYRSVICEDAGALSANQLTGDEARRIARNQFISFSSLARELPQAAPQGCFLLFAVSLRIMKIPRTPRRRITPLFAGVRFCSRKGHSLAIFTHTPSSIVFAKSAEDYSWEIAEWQLARRSIGAGCAEVWPFCHSGFSDTFVQNFEDEPGRRPSYLTLATKRVV
jgi:hypothetical protein